MALLPAALALKGARSATPAAVVPATAERPQLAGQTAAAARTSQMLKVLSKYRQLSVQDVQRLTGNNTELVEETLGALIQDGEKKQECDLCGPQQWLFILSTRGTDSTAMLQVLNSIPAFYLAGENMGVMSTMVDMYEAKDAVASVAANNPAFRAGPIDDTGVKCAMQEFVRVLLGDSEGGRQKEALVVGFKETHHQSWRQLDFFDAMFPCARFLILAKPFEEIGVNDEKLQKATLHLRDWQKANAAKAYLLEPGMYDEAHLNGMLKWLGVTGCEFSTIQWPRDMTTKASAFIRDQANCAMEKAPWRPPDSGMEKPDYASQEAAAAAARDFDDFDSDSRA